MTIQQELKKQIQNSDMSASIGYWWKEREIKWIINHMSEVEDEGTTEKERKTGSKELYLRE